MSAQDKDKIMHRFPALFSFFALLAVSLVASAQGEEQAAAAPHDSDWVAQKVQVCASCHGEGGVSTTPNFPIIAGQYESYLLHALMAYRDGGRDNAIMGAQVQGLTTAQLQALAEYFSSQASPLYTPSLDKRE